MKSPGTWEWHGIEGGGREGWDCFWYILVFCYFKYNTLKINSFLGFVLTVILKVIDVHLKKISKYTDNNCHTSFSVHLDLCSQ